MFLLYSEFVSGSQIQKCAINGVMELWERMGQTVQLSVIGSLEMVHVA